MSDSRSSKVSKNDVPGADAIRDAVLQELASGRSRNIATVRKSVEKRLEVTAEQRAFKIGKSSTTLFDNRFENARAALKREGLVEYPSSGKIKLTNDGKKAVFELLTGVELLSASDISENDAEISAAIDSDAVVADEPAYELIDDDSDLVDGTIPAIITDSDSDISVIPDSSSGITERIPSPFPTSAMNEAKPSGLKAVPKKHLAVAGGAAAVLLAAVLVFGGGSGSGASADQTTNSNDASAAAMQVDKKADGVLSFTLEPDGDVPNLRFQVLVDGKTDAGEEVHDYYSAEVGTKYALEYGAGTYALSVVSGTLTHDDVVYKATDSTVTFDAESDKALQLAISKDKEATAALADEKQKEADQKAAEEAAKKQAEEEAAAKEAEEAAAKQKVEEEAEAEEQQQTENASAEEQEQTVYITNSGTKYHKSGCKYLKKSKTAISLSDALAQGYEPCKVCGG